MSPLALGPQRLGFAAKGRQAPPLPVPFLFDAFDTFDGTLTNGMVFGTGAVGSLDTVNKIQGIASVNVQPGATTGNATVGYDKQPVDVYDPSLLNTMVYWMLINDNSDVSAQQFTLLRGATSGQVNYAQASTGRFPLGWQCQAFNVPIQMPAIAALPSGVLRRRAAISGSSINGRNFNFDACFANAGGRSKIQLGYDDGYLNQLINGTAIMIANGFGSKMILNAEYSKLTGAGSGTSQRMNHANVDAFVALGGQVCNQADGDDLTPDPAAGAALLNQRATDIVAAGWDVDGSSRMISWPNGSWTNALITDCQGYGFTHSRGIQNFEYYTRMGLDAKKWAFPSVGAGPTTTVGQLTAWVDTAIATGSDLSFHFHDISDTPSAIGVQTAVYAGLVQYIRQKVNANLCDVVNRTEWYALASAGSLPAF